MQNSDFLTADEIEDRYGIDLIQAEMIRAGLIEVTRHMFRTIKRSGFSNVVRELQDFGVCLHVVEDEGTELVATTEGCTHFAFTHPPMTNMVLDEWGLSNLRPGDTLICNDPWRGSIHLPDVNLFRPVFWDGKPKFVLSDASHLIDMGGPVPGSFNPKAAEVYEEGLRLPPMLITSEDQPVRSVISLILDNTRTPVHNLGDLRALFGTMKVGEDRLRRLVDQHGIDAVKAATKYTLDLAQRRMERAIDLVPDGLYEANEWIDDDGVGEQPVHLHATARVAGRAIEIDFSGTDRQPLGALTTCWEETSRVLIGAKLLLDRNHPMNSGGMRPFHVLGPPGSVVMGLPPTSNSQHADVAIKVCGLAIKLFSQMVPDRAIASESGHDHAYVSVGIDDRPGREHHPFGVIICGAPAWGATATNDGLSFCSTAIFGLSSSIVELMERDAPLLIRGLSLTMDGAGAGEFRSGFCSQVLIECLAEEMQMTFLLDSGRFPPAGIAGGGAGMTSYIFKVKKNPDNSLPQLNGIIPLDRLVPLAGKFDVDGRPDPESGEWCRGTELRTLKPTGYVLKRGEVLMMIGAPGGGYGSPLNREPEKVMSDVWNERLSLSCAERVYGVVLDRETLQVDRQATAEKRKQLKRAFQAGEWAPPISVYAPWPRTWDELVESDAIGTSLLPATLQATAG